MSARARTALAALCAVLAAASGAVRAATPVDVPGSSGAGRPQDSARLKPVPAARAAPTIQVPTIQAAKTEARNAQALAPDAGRARRGARMAAIKSWGNQLQELDVETARRATFDMLVVDAAGGATGGRALTHEEVAALKIKPDGSPRVLISYLSIGEAEDYRPDYFDAEYLIEEEPEFILSENERWKGNRRVSFCHEGWQRTILGDDDGRNVYNSVEPSPLYRLIEAGVDGVYLDRVDVYSEVEKHCPDAARKMVSFVARLAAHARKKNPDFIVILQNAEELLAHAGMVTAIDGVAKEDLFFGADHSERANDAGMVRETVKNLSIARDAGRPVFVLDYIKDAQKRALDKGKIEALGFIPYFGPRKLDHMWFGEAGH